MAGRGIDKRCTIEGVMFSDGDYLVRIGRYFDRVAPNLGSGVGGRPHDR